MDSNDRKKQTHLRCERQRREAINVNYWLVRSSFVIFQSGYNDLKELLPASSSFNGCKVTNASILFRAADYVKSLDDKIKEKEKQISGFSSSQAAMCMIIQQYENMGADKPRPLQTEIVSI
jgi:hypothetical protein